MNYPCIQCGKEVTTRQQAVECDWCHRRQHRACVTGISLKVYREALKLGRLTFICSPCVLPIRVKMSEPADDSDEPPTLEPSAPVADVNESYDEDRQRWSLAELSVKSFVADFERGIWQALRLVFDNSQILGCAFHWCQPVWRKLQEEGLLWAYNQRDAVFKFCRKVFALPFLPGEHIPAAFEKLKGKARNAVLDIWITYIGERWLSSTIWPISTWSIFGKTIRTNNDVEGWHHRLNRKARKSNLQFYLMLTLLYKEAQKIPSQVKMVSEGKSQKTPKSADPCHAGKTF